LMLDEPPLIVRMRESAVFIYPQTGRWGERFLARVLISPANK
jgi:hypothetical protein